MDLGGYGLGGEDTDLEGYRPGGIQTWKDMDLGGYGPEEIWT